MQMTCHINQGRQSAIVQWTAYASKPHAIDALLGHRADR